MNRWAKVLTALLVVVPAWAAGEAEMKSQARMFIGRTAKSSEI